MILIKNNCGSAKLKCTFIYFSLYFVYFSEASHMQKLFRYNYIMSEDSS
jgi:hypothetical protein